MKAPCRLLAGRAALSFALAAGVASSVSAALAQQAPGSTGAAELATARALGIEGVKLADANNCAEAVARLERAESLHHAPTTLGRLGECHVQLGAIVLGTELLNRVVREALAADAPQVFVLAKARAQRVLEQALPKIAKLKITVKAPPGARPQVAIDGEPVSPALLEVDRPTDPGAHQIEASAAGYKPARATVTLPEGGVEAVELALEPDPNAPRAPAEPRDAGAPSRAPGAPARGASPSRRVITYSLLGVGVAGVVAGSVLGAVTLSKASDLETQCPNKRCLTDEARDDLDGTRRMGTWSTIAFGVGGAGLVGGAVLLLTSPSAARAPAPRSFNAPGSGWPAIRARVGFGSFGVEGAF